MNESRGVWDSAIEVHQAGDLGRAEQLYRRVLRLDPYHADALHRLGVVAYQAGRPQEAVQYIGKAIAMNSRNPSYHGHLGAAYSALGRWDEAVESYQHAVQLEPQDAQVHYNLGVVLLRQKNWVGALNRFKLALELQPDFAEAWNSLGNVHEQAGNFDQAANCYVQAMQLDPQSAEAPFNLGNVRLAQSRLPEAVACYSRALQMRPQFVEALNNLGTALRQLGRFEQAAESYALAVRIQPQFAEAHNNLGTTLTSLGRLAEAEACYRRAIALNPENAAARNNLGSVQHEQGQLAAATQSFAQALKLRPHYADALANQATTLQSLGQVAQAQECYRQALQIDPGQTRVRVQAALLLPTIYESIADVQHWRQRFEHEVDRLLADGITLDPTQELVPVSFALAYQGENDRPLQQKLASLCRTRSATPTAPPLPRIHPGTLGGLETEDSSRIQIGFVSKFFYGHSIGHLLRGVMAQLDREKFQVTVISIGTHEDDLAHAIREHADRWLSVPEHLPAALHTLSQLQLDILVYPDIGMEPISTSLAHSRLAPVQCVTWGHPVTTGIPTLDYFLSSELLEVDTAQDHYSEQLVRLQSLGICFQKPSWRSELKDRAAFGLPADQTIYLCPQSLFKLHPEFDLLLRDILERDREGCLAFIEAPHPHWTELLSQRLRTALGPHFDRVRFVPRQSSDDFLQLLSVCDVMLDPLHFGGGTTSLQALAFGVPIVTLPSLYMRGRWTLGCYRRMGHTSCVATSAAEYVEIAVRLGTDAAYRETIRRELSAASQVLYDDHSAVRELEQFFQQALAATHTSQDRAA